MGKLKLQVQISMDGFIAGPAGEMDWLQMDWDQALKDYIARLTENVDRILLGRKLAEGFIPHWSGHPEEEGAAFINNTKKVVFSHTLKESKWDNTVVENGDLATAVRELKKQADKDLLVYGGAGFVNSLIRESLIDEFHLLVNATILGKGLSVFDGNKKTQQLKLVETIPFECGIALLRFDKRDS